MTKYKNKLSLAAIILLLISNTIPLFGVIFLAWDSFTIIFLYWAETAIVGFFNVLKIRKINKNIFSPWLALFIAQYVLFLFAYLYLILNIFDINIGHAEQYLEALKIVFKYFYSLTISFFIIFISHGFSFQYNFINKKEFLGLSEKSQVLAPYKRMLIMHLVLILVGRGVVYYDYDKNTTAIIILVVLKIIFDIIFHIFEHNNGRNEK